MRLTDYNCKFKFFYMFNYLELFFEEFMTNDWVGILKFNGFSFFAIVLGPFIREVISDIKDKIFDPALIIISAILLGLVVWCGFAPLTSSILEVRIVAIVYFFLFLLGGSFAYRNKV